MPEDVAFFVAKNVRSNVRELEGALRKILAYSRFNQKEVSIQLAREALRDLLSIQNRQISVENIQKTVADYYKIKVADMYSKKRPASDCPAPPDCHVLGQGADAKKPARNWRAVWRARPHHGAARGAQDFGRAPDQLPSSTSNCTCWSKRSRAEPDPGMSPASPHRQNGEFAAARGSDRLAHRTPRILKRRGQT